jgi:hypothetical protein
MAEPEGSENWPVLDKNSDVHLEGGKKGFDRPAKGEPGHVPCWWSNHGHTESSPNKGYGKKYADRYDDIEWED